MRYPSLWGASTCKCLPDQQITSVIICYVCIFTWSDWMIKMNPVYAKGLWFYNMSDTSDQNIPAEKFWLPVAKIILPLALGETTCVHILPIVNKQCDSYIL